jgi:DNA-binding MarR family transcriptional regulator
MLGPMPPAVRVRADFESVYHGASREATECAMNLVKTGDMVVSRVAAILRGFGLSPAGGLVLSMLADAQEPPSQAEVKERLLVSGPTVTGVLDSLERRGLVRRVFHPSDRRRRLVEITKDGRLVAAAFLPLVHAAQRPWMACLNNTEQRQLIDLLDRIQTHLSTSHDNEPAAGEPRGVLARSCGP